MDNRLPHRFILAGDIYKRVAPGEALDPRARHRRSRNARKRPDPFLNAEKWSRRNPDPVSI
jgi:hypothetical protein